MGGAFETTGGRATVVARGDYDVPYYVHDVSSLLFWLRALDLPVGGFHIERHWRQVARLIREYSTARGIQTNEHRTLLVLRRE